MSWLAEIQDRLLAKKQELTARLERVQQHYRRPLDADSSERAVQMENHEVVDSLGNEAREELAKVEAALSRLATGDYGVCIDCTREIGQRRLNAHPYARRCISCAEAAEKSTVQSQH